MDVLSQMESDYNQALKEKNELAVLVLRQLKTAISNTEIANNREPITEEGLTKLFRSEVKKRRDSAELYRKGGREELAKKEEEEITLISKYLPEELSEEVVKQKAEEVISQIGAAGPQDTGKVMGLVMKELGSAADGSVVSKIVADILKQK